MTSKFISLIWLIVAWFPVWACNVAPAESSVSATDLAWSVKADFNSAKVSSACDDALDQILRQLDVRRDFTLSLEAITPSWGSLSLGLAKISTVAMQIQQALRKKSNRFHVPIEIRLLPAGAASSKPSDGRHYILRLHQITH